jgi:hypothetical protein
MKRLLVRSFLGAALVAGTVSAFAADPPKTASEAPKAAVAERAGNPPTRMSPSFEAAHGQASSFFDNYLGTLTRIETDKLIRDGDAEALEKSGFSYAESMKRAFDLASSEAQEAGKSQGKLGNVASLKMFEETAEKHQQASITFERRFNQIQFQLKSGEIKLDRPILQKMGPADLKQFKQFLAPQGLQEMERLHPDLMKGPVGKSSLESHEEPVEYVAVATQVSVADQMDALLGNLIEDLGPRKAEAGLVVPCIGPCIQRNWTACVNCIVSKGPAAINAWNTFVRCWNGAGTCNGWPWNWGHCIQKARCLAQLIAKLA